MRKLSAAFIAASLIIALGNFDMALGASKTPVTKKQTGTNQVETSSVSALTEAECTGLSGTVKDVPASDCASQRRCNTVDANGVVRRVCITKQ